MAGVTKQLTDRASDTTEQFTEAVKRKAELQADSARQEVGEAVFDATDKYFPQAVRRRRRRDVASGVVLGLLVGFLIRYVIGER